MSFAFLAVSCTEENAPEPACLQVEVIGEDCNTGWFILKIENETGAEANTYQGQLQSGFVTTDNLPQAYRQPGLTYEAALELNGDYGPRCVAVTVMYPAVKIVRICGTATDVK